MYLFGVEEPESARELVRAKQANELKVIAECSIYLLKFSLILQSLTE
jgi:hypothetical protein